MLTYSRSQTWSTTTSH